MGEGVLGKRDPLTNAREIGEFVLVHRRRKGWSQSDLAGFANVSRNTISQIECGKNDGWTFSLIGVIVVLGFDVIFTMHGITPTSKIHPRYDPDAAQKEIEEEIKRIEEEIKRIEEERM